MTVYNLSHNSFAISWSPVPQEFANGKIQGYRVRVWELSQWLNVNPNVTTGDNGTIRALIGGLKPYTSYMITVAAFTSAGDGNASQINITSDEGGKFFLTQKSQP